MNKKLKETLSTILYLAGVVLFTAFILIFVGQRTDVSGDSMEATLTDGDSLIVDKITYRFQDPQRFDIIVFPFKYQEATYYIKRIIGLPGEKVWIDEEGVIYINDQILKENYGREVIDADNRGVAAEPIVLGPDEYFVMGDNRNNSSDSRTQVVGNIKRKDIIGRAWLRIWPLDQFGVLKHE